VITIPSQMLLPDTPREGIVVNLAELRLYYFPPGKHCSGLPAGYWAAGAGNAGDDHAREPENPESTWTPRGHQSAFSGAGH
jgi:L,D-transpeptidase YnhG